LHGSQTKISGLIYQKRKTTTKIAKVFEGAKNNKRTATTAENPPSERKAKELPIFNVICCALKYSLGSATPERKKHVKTRKRGERAAKYREAKPQLFGDS
jgi:hypothetical protein